MIVKVNIPRYLLRRKSTQLSIYTNYTVCMSEKCLGKVLLLLGANGASILMFWSLKIHNIMRANVYLSRRPLYVTVYDACELNIYN